MDNMFTLLVIIFLSPFAAIVQSFQSKMDETNYSPVIGILTMPSQDSGNQSSPSNFPASYVKFIESAGGRVIPVMVGMDSNYYAKMVNLTSGMLFTGGTIVLNESIYTESAYYIWKLALKANDEGHFYPIFGICQGFEFFLYAANGLGNDWPLIKCEAENLVQPLNFLLDREQLKQTQLFQSAPDSIIEVLSNHKVTYNSHTWCLPVNSMEDQSVGQVGNFYKVLASSLDSNNLQFVSLIESINYPIYGLQFHPEKPAFEAVISPDRSNTPHSIESILIGQYFANFFIGQAKKSDHKFPDHNLQYREQLIYNYCPQYDALNASSLNQQIYYFN